MIIILICFVCAVDAIINPYGPTVVRDFANCLNMLIEKNFKKPGVLVFIDTNNVITPVSRIRTDLLKKINDKMLYSVEVTSPGYNELDVCDNYDEKLGTLHIDIFVAVPTADYFIIVIDKYEDFPYVASKLIRSRSWNPSAKIIILLFNFTNSGKVNIGYVEKMFNCLFKYNAINIIVVVPQENNIRNAVIYGWRPYDPPKYCGYFNESAKDRLLVENTCEQGIAKHDNNVFDGRIPLDMKGCILQIIALEKRPFISKDVDDVNIEKILINEILRKYKFETNYTIIDGFRGERDQVGVWSGALKELASKKGHVLLGGIFPDFDVHEDFDCSSSYLADSYTWVVPRAYPSPPWVALIIIFQKLVWYSVVIGFIFCAFSWKILGQLSGDSSRNKSIDHCFLNAWICTLGFSAYIRPIGKSLRLFFVFFNIYCVIFITAYQTKLIDILRNPTFEHQIKTVEELVKSGLKFGGFEELHDLFYNSTDSADNFLGAQWVDVDDMAKAMIDVAVYRNFSVLCSRLELAHISAAMPELSDSYGNYKYYAFDLNMVSVPSEMVALKGFTFMKKFSVSLNMFKQNGINEAIRRHFATFNNRRRAKLLRSLLRERPDIISLSLQHLQGGFLALALGYAFGTLIFFLEIIVNCEFVKDFFITLKF